MNAITEPGLGSIETILVGTDFSPCAELALKWATMLASRRAAQLAIVHAIDSEFLPEQSRTGEELGAAAEERLDAMAATVERAGVRAVHEWHLAPAWEVIIDAAKRCEADLIVLGSRGLTAFDRIMLGSTADRVLRNAQTPVMVVHPGNAVPKEGPRCVLAAVDFSVEANAAMETAIRLLDRGADEAPRLVLMHACTVPLAYPDLESPYMVPSWTDEQQRDAEARLEAIAEPLRETLDVEIRAPVGFPVKTILDEAQSVNADVIAVGTQGRSGLARLLMGSVAERVLHHAPVPVLAAPCPPEGPTAQVEKATTAQSSSVR
jgi:nucleotide-binding universal stress UspA family protein